jgi:hypothetical protein
MIWHLAKMPDVYLGGVGTADAGVAGLCTALPARCMAIKKEVQTP